MNSAQAAEIVSLKSDVATKQAMIDELVENRTKNQAEINKLVGERDDLQAQLTASLDNAAELTIQLDDRDVKISDLQNTIAELQEQHKAELIEEYATGYEAAEAIYKAKLTRTGTYNGVAFSTEYANASDAWQAGFDNGVHSLTATVNSLTHKRDQLQKELDATVANLVVKTAEWVNRGEMIEERDLHIDELDAEIGELSTKVNQLTIQVEVMTANHLTYVAELTALKDADYDGLVEHFSEGNPGYDAIFGMGAASVTPEDGVTQADLDAANGEIEDLHFEVNEAYEEIEDLLDEISDMNAELPTIINNAKQEGINIAKQKISDLAAAEGLGSIDLTVPGSNGFPRSVTQMAEILKNRAYSAGYTCLLYTSPSPRDRTRSRMPSSA